MLPKVTTSGPVERPTPEIGTDWICAGVVNRLHRLPSLRDEPASLALRSLRQGEGGDVAPLRRSVGSIALGNLAGNGGVLASMSSSSDGVSRRDFRRLLVVDGL